MVKVGRARFSLQPWERSAFRRSLIACAGHARDSTLDQLKFDREVLYRRLFDAGVLIKGLDGVFEVLGGLVLWLTARPSIIHVVGVLTRGELAEDPKDLVATHLRAMAHHLSAGQQHFVSFYLLGHGVIKLVLVTGLLRGWHWSFPAATTALIMFIGYQSYRLAQAPSGLLLALTVLDIAVVALVIHQWRVRRTAWGRPA